MFQPDLFGHRPFPNGGKPTSEKNGHVHAERVQSSDGDLDLPGVLERLAGISARPRYTFMVLNLIARVAGETGRAGPYVQEGGQAMPVRDWLSDAMLPIAQRDARRLAIVEEIRSDLRARGILPIDPGEAEALVGEMLRSRLRKSGRTNISRAVSDLVRAGLLHRHYQGYRVDHENRGAQREAVYTVSSSAKRALGRTG